MITIKPALVVLSLLLFSSFAQANPMDGMYASGMQELMKNMQGIQQCMAGIDQKQLQAIAEKAQVTQNEVKRLCATNEAAKARKTALDFAGEMQKSPELTKMQNCLKDLPEMMQGHIPGTDMAKLQKEYEKEDICALLE